MNNDPEMKAVIERAFQSFCYEAPKWKLDFAASTKTYTCRHDGGIVAELFKDGHLAGGKILGFDMPVSLALNWVTLAEARWVGDELARTAKRRTAALEKLIQAFPEPSKIT